MTKTSSEFNQWTGKFYWPSFRASGGLVRDSQSTQENGNQLQRDLHKTLSISISIVYSRGRGKEVVRQINSHETLVSRLYYEVLGNAGRRWRTQWVFVIKKKIPSPSCLWSADELVIRESSFRPLWESPDIHEWIQVSLRLSLCWTSFYCCVSISNSHTSRKQLITHQVDYKWSSHLLLKQHFRGFLQAIDVIWLFNTSLGQHLIRIKLNDSVHRKERVLLILLHQRRADNIHRLSHSSIDLS